VVVYAVSVRVSEHTRTIVDPFYGAKLTGKVGKTTIGVMYANGQGVPQDDIEAVKWHRKAAEQGLADAQNNLGVAYANGQGVPQDFSEAYVWYSLSAANNGPEKATTFRDLNRENLTPDQVAAAQKRAKELFEEIEKKKGSH